MSNNEVVAEWIRFAKRDLTVAKHIFNAMLPKPLEVVCFHCQQSAEKALKAYLIHQNVDFPKIHDLTELCKLCTTFTDSFYDIYDYCAGIYIYAVEPRYPYGVNITMTETISALSCAEFILNHVIKLLDCENVDNTH